MRILLLLMILLASCVKTPEVSEGSRSTASVNPEAPYLWASYSSAKTLYLSNNFTSDEAVAITNMATAWRTAVSNKKTFFNISSNRVSNKSNNINPDLLYDTILGIYKTTVWPQDIPTDALAVTQIFGRRYNVGEENEFVGIEHADIMVNYQHFIFDHDDNPAQYDPDYDLPTVILHELGHFIGMGHIPRSDERTSSVMYPSITSREVKRIPKGRDITALAEKYRIDLGEAAPAMASGQKPLDHTIPENDLGVETRVVMELRASGECVHKVDGRILKRHKAF